MAGPTRVMATGAGIISALSLDAADHFVRLVRGESGVAPSRSAPLDGYGSLPEARVQGFCLHSRVEHRMLRKLLPSGAAFAVAAARQALRDAGLVGDAERLSRAGLYVGSVQLEIDFDTFVPALRASLDEAGGFDLRRFAVRGMKALDPLFLVRALPNAGLGAIAMHDQVTGPNLNLTNGSASGLQAIALAAAAVRRGEVDLAVAGGYDCLLQIENLTELLVQGRLAYGPAAAERPCRPFDRDRAGTVAGEGAAFVVLEAEAHARARGARAYAEVEAAAHTTSAHADHGPDAGQALHAAAARALQSAACEVRELDALFGDGLGTREDDLREAAAARRLPLNGGAVFTAPTAAIGFTGAASGSFSFVHAALALHAGVVPPQINSRVHDPECALPLAAPGALRVPRRVLAWSSDRGIKNVALLLKAVDRDAR